MTTAYHRGYNAGYAKAQDEAAEQLARLRTLALRLARVCGFATINAAQFAFDQMDRDDERDRPRT